MTCYRFLSVCVVTVLGAGLMTGCSREEVSPVAVEESPPETVAVPQNDQNLVHTVFNSDHYHTSECADLGDRETYAGPVDEAKEDGFTPCAKCNPPS